MPNWCNNTLEITGPKEEIRRFITETTSDDQDNQAYTILANLVRMPEILADTTSPTPESPNPHPKWLMWLYNDEITLDRYNEMCSEAASKYQASVIALEETGYGNWYDWQYANWGIKWGDTNTRLRVISSTGTFAVFHFDTAWGPATAGFTNVSRLFPELTFVIGYAEPGMCFLGAEAFRNGTVTSMIGTYPTVDGDDDDAWEDAVAEADSVIRSMMDALSTQEEAA